MNIERSPAHLVTPPQPYYLPGYTGYCPQYRFRCGRNLSQESHRLLQDPNVNHSRQLVLAETRNPPPRQDPSQLIQERCLNTDCIFVPPFTANYKGFVPRAKQYIGMTETKARYLGLADFEEKQKTVRDHYHLLQVSAARTTENRPLVEAAFKAEDLQELKARNMENE